jgi:hypothetical protein
LSMAAMNELWPGLRGSGRSVSRGRAGSDWSPTVARAVPPALSCPVSGGLDVAVLLQRLSCRSCGGRSAGS